MLLRSPARVVIYGGGAGGGKSYASLLQALRWRQTPGYRCGVFRLDRPRLTQEGGLWDESKLMFPWFGGEPNQSALSWTFPSGAVIKLNGLQGERSLAGKDGGQIPVIQIDELQEFTRKMFFYLFTRNRGQVPGIPTIIRGYCNPDPDGAPWLSELLQWWWDPETGYAIPERSGVIRWFVQMEGKIIWGASRGELVERFPNEQPISMTFIKSRVEDNPILLRNNPAYLAALMNQDTLIREIKLHGNFKIRAISGTLFNRAWFPLVDETPIDSTRVRYWDLAAVDETEAEQKGTDPDYTCGIKLGRCNTTLQEFVEDMIHGRFHPRDVRQLILNTAHADGYETRVRIEFEGGSHTKYVEHEFLTLLEGFDVEFVRATKSKSIRAAGVSSQAKARNICVKRSLPHLERFFSELEIFPRKGRNIHDDIVDALSGAHNELAMTDREPTDEEIQAAARLIQAGIPAKFAAGRWGR